MNNPFLVHHPGPAKSTREFLDDMNAEDDEQKFCCGDMTNRFCCSFAEKLREVPGFDPSKHYDSRSSSRHVFTNFLNTNLRSFSAKYYLTIFSNAQKREKNAFFDQ